MIRRVILCTTSQSRIRSTAYGLRLPASASCKVLHLRPTGRCPNNSSLFLPLAAVVVVALVGEPSTRLSVDHLRKLTVKQHILPLLPGEVAKPQGFDGEVWLPAETSQALARQLP